MKILYIGHERRGALIAATALRSTAPNVTLTWARSHGAALSWIRDNRDASAVIVDPAPQPQDCKAFVAQVRDLGLTTPVAVIAAEHVEGLLAALKPGLSADVDRERSRNRLLDAQLREAGACREQEQQRVADLQAQHEASLARATRIGTALQTRLLELEGALHKAEQRDAARSAAAGEWARREKELSAAVAGAVAARAEAERRLADGDAADRDARQRAAAELTAAIERCATAETRLSAEMLVRTTLEDRLAGAGIARQEADRKHAEHLASLTARLAEREAQHTTSLARVNKMCTALQERLLELETAIRAAEERHAADVKVSERLALRETELSAA